MSSNTVLFEKEGAIGKIILNRPEKRNQINRELFLALGDAVDKALADNDVRVIVFLGNGDHFCNGFDPSDPEACLNADESGEVDWFYRKANTQEEIDLWMKIYNSPKPTIGAIKGDVVGGGYFMVLMFDCVVAAEGTMMENTEFALGWAYTNYVPFEAWKIPMNVAKEKALTGYPITAHEGFRLGLFNRVVPVEELEDCAMTLARRMLKLAPYTLSMHKELYNLAYSMQGITNIVPYAKEVFNIALHLPGTKENQDLWALARENPEKVLEICNKLMSDMRKEEVKELSYLDDIHE